MNQTLYFSFVLIVSGIVFANRMSVSFIGKLSLSRQQMAKIGTLYLLYSLIVFFQFHSSPFYLFLWVFAANFIWPMGFAVYKKHLERQFQSEFLRFSSVVILKMKMGEGFRSAYQSTLDLGAWRFRALLSELLENVAFSPQIDTTKDRKSDQFLVDLLRQLQSLDRNPGTALLQFMEFRDHLQKSSKFRRRSGQIWGQILAQAITVGVLYLLLMAYMVANYQLLEHVKLIVGSLAFFVLGLIALLLMSRSPKWKI